MGRAPVAAVAALVTTEAAAVAALLSVPAVAARAAVVITEADQGRIGPRACGRRKTR